MPIELAPHTTRQIRFDEFEVHLDRGELHRDGKVIQLQDKPLQLLVFLLRRSGQVVTRDEIRSSLWGAETAGDRDDNLNHAVQKLRGALGDSADNPRFIRTVPRRGYQFLVAPLEPPPTAPDPQRVRGHHTLPTIAAVATAAVLSIALAALWIGTPVVDGDAEREYVTGLNLLRRRDLKSMKASTEHLRHAVELNPRLAKAWAGLAEAALFVNESSPAACLQLAQQSVRMDPRCGECHAILGFALFSRYWKWEESGQHLARGRALAPGDPQISYWYAQREAILGRPAYAQRVIDETLQRFPQAFNLLVMKSGVHYFQRDHVGAIRVSDQLLALNLPGGWAWRTGAVFLLGRQAEAVRSLANDLGAGTSRSAETIAQRTDEMIGRFMEAGMSGPLEDLLALTSGSDAANPQAHNRAVWLMMLNRHNEALRELDNAVQARSFNLMYIGVDPIFDPVRDRSEFRSVLQRIGLAP